jgi:ABC-2 type transport system permease protein
MQRREDDLMNDETRVESRRPGEKFSGGRNVARYGGIYAALWKNSVTRELMFKTNFLLWIVVEILWFALQLGFIAVIYLHTDQIGSWTKWQVVLLVGTSHFIQQIFSAIFLINCTNLSELVRTGKLDFILMLPVNTRFVLSLRQVDLGGFVNAGTAVAVIVYALGQLEFVPSLAQVGGYLGLCVIGICVHYCLMFSLATVSFWTVRAQGIVYGYYNLFNIARLPDDAFRPGVFKVVFTFVLPVLLVSNVPARLFTERLTDVSILLLVGLALVCAVGSEWIWRRSLRHYRSASS